MTGSIEEAVRKLQLLDDMGDPVKVGEYHIMESPQDKERLEVIAHVARIVYKGESLS